MLDAGDAGGRQALNVVLAEHMALGQTLFYALHRLFLLHQHAVSDALVAVMPASAVVDATVPPAAGVLSSWGAAS